MLKNTITHKPNLKLQFKINKNLIQSFKILQMSVQEMHEFAKKEIEINPVLSMNNIGKNNNSSELIEKYVEKPNIKNWLYQQSYTLFEKKDKRLVKIYIENLDDNGFCRISAEEVANLTSSSITNAKKVLQRLKTLDPIGIFSQSLEENLEIQLKNNGIYNNNHKIMLNNLELIASYNISKLMQLCNLSEQEIKKIIKQVKNLNPRPLDSFSPDITNIAIVDIIVLIDKDKKEILISLNKEQNLKLKIDKEYVKKIKIQKQDSKTKKYINDCMSHARWLQNTLNHRNKTIMSVSKKVLNYQKKFFIEGPEHMLPLTLKKVASMCKLHETTIGRTINNKFIFYDNNILLLKDFFNSKIKSSEKHKNISSSSIKYKMRQIINSEKIVKNTYSDQKLVELFSKNGIIISRRTIAKYRETMNIPSSVVRSRQVNF